MYALDSLNQMIHGAVAYLILLWSVFSATLEFRKPKLWVTIDSKWLPLIPLRLAPLFFLQPFFYFTELTAKPDELGELFLGVAALSWAIDLSVRNKAAPYSSALRSVGIMFGTFSLAALISLALTSIFSTPPVWRLNLMAERGYPLFKMNDQAENIYSYIYSHPIYLTPYTRINHGELLIKLGRKSEANELLKFAMKDLESSVLPKEQLDKYQKRLSTLLQQ